MLSIHDWFSFHTITIWGCRVIILHCKKIYIFSSTCQCLHRIICIKFVSLLHLFCIMYTYFLCSLWIDGSIVRIKASYTYFGMQLKRNHVGDNLYKILNFTNCLHLSFMGLSPYDFWVFYGLRYSTSLLGSIDNYFVVTLWFFSSSYVDYKAIVEISKAWN